MFNKAILGLGGNLGDREFLLDLAIKSCEQLGKIVKVSSVYETAAWGGVASASFLNQIIILETTLDPEMLLQKIQAIEIKLGRKRIAHWGDRTMDIDLLFFDDRIIKSKILTVPHVAIPDRRFVLIPLAEIFPDFIHPLLGKSIEELLLVCPDTSQVVKFNQAKKNLPK